MRRIVILLIMGLLLFGCGSKKNIRSKSKKQQHKKERVVSKKPVITPKVIAETPASKPEQPVANLSPVEAYIATYSAIAQDEMRLYKIPASIKLAQGILESSSGRGRLAVQAKNHFGIKCHEWTGARIYHDDDEAQECFRKYTDAKYSYRDHSLFLTERRRYYKLFDLDITDYKGWARELKAAGYATDRKYPDKLISLIERYNLYEYDEVVVGKRTTVSAVSEPINGHRVVKGDTLYSLSRRYNTSVETLKKLNNLTSNNLQIGDILIVKAN
ncbi:glucosaminidase domain-containing protein [Bizionia sediminis]|uniref:Peptidoglycan hydrolase n=1 Tax=Bizionia sediminis TaxID=1737064 RepID=A0ABW5KVE8_9FLAO